MTNPEDARLVSVDATTSIIGLYNCYTDILISKCLGALITLINFVYWWAESICLSRAMSLAEYKMRTERRSMHSMKLIHGSRCIGPSVPVPVVLDE